ncbi:hypothetical protein BJY16_008101 [Actinoplanes octamycinicus]|uniref:Uncharacterized protein n=1 Tax=Actinoplanes octamycinicus TaxID=135948 RepID=A0A7W7H6B2_9ACTN|nr:hypothetical protein [Actinoplanes octamycinicus]MBB4744642.1 hypothetical protein [Actinoplanes octamycinicus]GIE55223.1 hypothetical protein Aoc01nite_06250 [Actinoplanes octamycinicus]
MTGDPPARPAPPSPPGRPHPARLRLILAAAGAALMFLAALFPTWIEGVTSLDPDGGSGAVEWLLPLPFAAAALLLGALAHHSH